MDELFRDLPVPTQPASRPVDRPAPRVQRPNRGQLELRSVDLDGLLPADHRARLVWAFVEGLDLGPLYLAIRAREGEPGRPPIDPAILTALWLYATLEGVGSARALERLCDEHDAYRWLCGGVSVNYHTLADFRVDHGELFDRLLTNAVAALRAEGLVRLERVAQDGLRVRAAAGARSFRRKDKLAAALAEAEAQVAKLRAELHDDTGATNRRVAAARERAARERASRAQRALDALPRLEERKRRAAYHGKRVRPAVASTTDPDATYMKLADGGRAPALNVQLATDTRSQVIVGLDVVGQTDQTQLAPMVEQLATRYGRPPAQHLVDGGYMNRRGITRAGDLGCAVFMPLPPLRNKALDPYRRRSGDSEAVLAWRRRMASEDATGLYKERSAVAECVNAIARNRGLRAFNVRGFAKARAVLIWYALAHNLLRAVSLRAAAAASAA